MAETINAFCSICGKGYHMCQSCKDYRNLYPYKLHTDTAEHYKIYQILNGYSTGVYNEDETYERLQKVDLSDLETYRDEIKNLIKKILNAGKTNKKDDAVIETTEDVKLTKASRKKKSSEITTTDKVDTV
jgi:hypothetical protein